MSRVSVVVVVVVVVVMTVIIMAITDIITIISITIGIDTVVVVIFASITNCAVIVVVAVTPVIATTIAVSQRRCTTSLSPESLCLCRTPLRLMHSSRLALAKSASARARVLVRESPGKEFKVSLVGSICGGLMLPGNLP